MKKYFNVVLILTLLLMFSVSGTALAQEEPTAEPTEEPTAEPTEEPTAEPTEEPTAEPTEEPTAEPTEEPTAEPTEEPTAEPTIETSGDIDTQATPGSWTTTHIGIQNLDTSTTANVALRLYPIGSGSTATINKTIYPRGSVYVSSSEFSNGQYSGVIESNTPLAAGTVNVNTTGAADAYAGVNNPGTKFTLPLLFRNYSGGWSSTIYIQNASSTDGLVVTFKATKAGQTSPATTVTRTVDSNESVVIDMSTSEFNAFGSDYGSGVVEASQNIAVVASNFRNASGLYQATFYNGLPDSAAGTSLSAPLVFNVYSGGWNTGIQVVNTSTSSTNVTMTYTPSSGAPCVRTQSFAAGESKAFYLPSQGCPQGTFGSVSISTSGGSVVAIANAAKYSGGSVGYASVMLNPSIATTKVAVPIAFNGTSTSSWLTGIQAVNLDTQQRTVTARFVKQGVNPSVAGNTLTFNQTCSGNGGSCTFYLPTLIGTNSFKGSVFIESAGPVMALGSNTFYPNGYAANINGVNY